jgi:hypothetical protein
VAGIVCLISSEPASNHGNAGELVDRRNQRRARAHPGNLLDDDHRRERVRTYAAVRLWNVRRMEVSRHQRFEGCLGKFR